MANLECIQEDAKMDMTPMIDCVFLLMIFFVLVIDLSQQDLEDLILPGLKCILDLFQVHINIIRSRTFNHKQKFLFL